MSTVYFDAQLSDAERRRRLYDGDFFVFSPTPASRDFCRFARGLAEEAFMPLHPPEAQFGMPAEKYAQILAELKPRFIHHPESKQFIRQIFSELGCDLEETYFDVPRLRTMTHANYMAAGLAYPFHPHRDTWFSAPQCQLNWWIPVYDLRSENTIAFHPHYWDHPIRNSSREYNYYKWNKENRRLAAVQIKTDTRKQPQAEEPFAKEPQVRLVCPAGGIIIFSGAAMHSTVPNTSGCTRFSIDFRSVNLDDVIHKNGAPNLDSQCTGTTLRDFLRARDFQRLSEEIAAGYDQEPFVDGELIFDPTAAGSAAVTS